MSELLREARTQTMSQDTKTNASPNAPSPSEPASATAAGEAPAWVWNWEANLLRSAIGSPLLPVEYVAAQGPGVRLIDVRDPQEFIGPIGYIHGSDWVPPERLESLAERLRPDEPVVLISQHGERASEVARMLEARGLRYVAAMLGGVAHWISLGFGTTRDPSILNRCDVLSPITHPAPSPETSGALTAGDVEEHLGDPLSVRWVKLAALVLHAHLSCIDGRDDRGVVGTPGGDAGVFLLAISAIESALGRPIATGVVSTLFERRIDALGGFYMHTDQNALAAVADAMRHDRRLEPVLSQFDEPARVAAVLPASAAGDARRGARAPLQPVDDRLRPSPAHAPAPRRLQDPPRPGGRLPPRLLSEPMGRRLPR